MILRNCLHFLRRQLLGDTTRSNVIIVGPISVRKIDPPQFAKLNRAINEARLHAPIAAVYSPAQAAKAHERLEKGHILGRVALKIRSGRR